MRREISSGYVDPPGQPADWYAPLAIDVVDGQCEPSDAGCGPLEEVALDFTEDGQLPVQILSGNTGELASVLLGREYLIDVGDAHLGSSCGSLGDQDSFFGFVIAVSDESG